ncbi:hypothetical protein EV137_1823 [Kribbella pratensis]|uniref:Cupin domain-containing protein n=1 Tax=Kribbella pratensis TaxID=2512112 RepID=A0ABY2FNJ5_9ACTN|nr:hypothetical protein EV137_1823 [Kribbella pratensis]
MAANVGDLVAEVTVTLMPPTDAQGHHVGPKTVRIEPGDIALLVTTTGSVRIDSTQPIVPGGEGRVLHNGTQDVLTRLYCAAPLVWFELIPERIQGPETTQDPATRRVVAR